MREHSVAWYIFMNVKQLFSNLGKNVKAKMVCSIDRLKSKLPEQNNLYEDLAPKSDVENGAEYIKALHWGIKNQRVKNIALAGPFGSGKSSIIQTYLKEHPSTRALIISLATFDYEKKPEEDLEKQIELGILKQLFYKVDSDKIPQSRYRKLKKKYYSRYFAAIAGIAAIVLSCVCFFTPYMMKKILDYVIQSGSYYGLSKELSYSIAALYGFMAIAVFSYLIKWITSKFRIKEVNIVNSATVAEEKDEKSIFDSAMDEIVYFFEATKYDVVFIEDLDRFGDAKIFVKLRELNTILNNYDLIKRRIVFVYAIKDDLFKDNERSKFFDFIIPVIPIINSTNSGEILREKLKINNQNGNVAKNFLYKISAEYVTLVSPFIDDMRVLTNICNEFVTYKGALNNIKLNDERMFSLIIFKNLYPVDFAELEMEKGIVKQAFEKKKEFVSTKQGELIEQRQGLEKILNDVENNVLKDVVEIKAAFLHYLTGEGGPFKFCSVQEVYYYYNDIMKSDFNMSILCECSKIVSYDCDGKSNIIYPKSDRKVSEYIKRIENMQNIELTSKEELQEKIEELNSLITEMSTYSLQYIIDKFGQMDVLSESVRNNKLLVFLLRKGYINENYADYINYFHPNSVTKDEMDFIRGIRMQEAVGDFTYAIRNVSEVCDRIESYEFKQTEALNFDIADYLITKKKSDVKCHEFFAGLSQGGIKQDEFISAYIERKQNVEVFVNMLCGYYKGFWNKICKSELITEEKKYDYLALILEYADLDDIVCLNEFEGTKNIEEFMVKNKNILSKMSMVSIEKMERIIDELGVFFEEIDIEDVDKELLRYIFDNDKYFLNMNMLISLFNVLYPDRVEELKTSNYKVIRDVNYKPLLDRIYENFEGYISEYVVGQESNLNEDLDSVEDMIERLCGVNNELCLEVIDRFNVEWETLDTCCVSSEESKKQDRKIIWNCVFEKKKVKATWYTYVEYYNNYGMTHELIEWVSNSIDVLIHTEQNQEISDELLIELIENIDSVDTFNKIVENYSLEKLECDIEKFDEERARILIKNAWIPFSLECLETIKDNIPSLASYYILHNKDSFMNNLTEVTLDIGIIERLFQSNEFSDIEKIKLLDLFVPEDMSREIALIIRDIKNKLPKPYVEKAWELLSQEEKYQLFLNQLEVYSVDEISEKFMQLAPVYRKLSGLSKRHKEYLDITDYNLELLTKLKKLHYITSFEQEIYEQENFATHEKYQIQRYGIWVKQRHE